MVGVESSQDGLSQGWIQGAQGVLFPSWTPTFSGLTLRTVAGMNCTTPRPPIKIRFALR